MWCDEVNRIHSNRDLVNKLFFFVRSSIMFLNVQQKPRWRKKLFKKDRKNQIKSIIFNDNFISISSFALDDVSTNETIFACLLQWLCLIMRLSFSFLFCWCRPFCFRVRSLFFNVVYCLPRNRIIFALFNLRPRCHRD